MKLKLLFLLLLFGSVALAQDKVEVTGQVKDAQTKANLEFCTIAVYNIKDSLITSGATDEKGFFTLSLAEGSYNLVLNYVGYKRDTVKALEVEEKKFIGIIRLKPDAQVLKEVEVKTNSAENLLDRDVQIVTDKMKIGASTAKEVLEKVNGVTYDRYTNAIKVDNNSNVKILVDGMEKDQNYIKNLAPDRLKKIEVIRDPSGRYGLEGYSAVINIILKTDYKGTEIFVQDETMQDLDAPKKENIPVSNEADITLNYVYNKVNLYGSYNNSYSGFYINSFGKKEYTNGITVENKPMENTDVNLRAKEFSHEYTLGADYYLNPKHTIGFESDLSLEPQKYNSSSQQFTVLTASHDTVLNKYNSTLLGSSGSVSSTNTLFYLGKLNEKNEINANFNYSLYQSTSTNDYSDDLLFANHQSGKDNKNSTKLYLEYTHNFKNKTSLQLGYGNSWQQQHNSFTQDSAISNFTYSDVRHKLYAYYSWQAKKKFGVKIGAAAESSAPVANGISRNYIIAQPYADVKYIPNEKISFKLKYRADNKYPDIEKTNPFTTFVDKQSVETGNPLLKPEVTHKLSMQVDILGGLLTIEPYYHFSNNLITQTGTLRSDNIFEYTYSNSGNYTRYGSELRFTVPFGNTGFLLQSDADVFYNSIRYNNKINEFNYFTMSSQLFYQNEKRGTVAGAKYQKNLVHNITAQGYKMWDNDCWLAFVQQPFFKEKLNVMLLYFLPIDYGVHYNQGSYIKTDTYTETQYQNISLLKNILMLQINYRFTKGKSANRMEKKMEQENEKSKKSIF